MTIEFDDIYGSKYLTAADVKVPTNATIERVEHEQFTRPGEPTRTKAVLYFKGGKKGMVVNPTVAHTLAKVFGKSFAGWVGKRVTVKSEPTSFGGKPTQGLRAYPLEDRIAAAPPPPPPADGMDDQIPW